MANEIEDTPIDAALAEGGVIVKRNKKTVEKVVPVYQVYEGSRIPVSDVLGKHHKAKLNHSLNLRKSKNTEEAWEQAIKYFKNDQLGHRNGSNPDQAQNDNNNAGSKTFRETENVVFSNVNAMVPTLYAKNPKAEFTTDIEEYKKLMTHLERLVNILAHKKSAPGFNLKPKAKKAVVLSTLTNKAWFEVGYTKKSASSEEALNQLETLAKEYADAKDVKVIKEIEGKIQALENSVDILMPSGPSVTVKRPDQVVIDSNATMEDGSDGKFIASWELVQTDLLKAVYTKATTNKKGETIKNVSIFKSTHIVNIGASETKGIDEDINNFTIFDGEESDYSKYGYTNEADYQKAQYTKVWKFWDKITRRVYLYNDADWSWPIWVWEDPYQLEGFFPFTALTAYTDPVDAESKGEVTYYLDQQDAINEMLDEEAKLRKSVKNKLIFNKNIIKDENIVTDYLNGGEGTAVGVDVDAEINLENLFASPVSPAIKHLQTLFDPTRKFQAIDRISAVNSIMRNAEFKTNTTNRAIEVYESGTVTRLDERIDAVEDALGNVYWQVAQLCLMNMEADDVVKLIGPEAKQYWKTMTAEEIQTYIHVQVVGGSTSKPTSQVKKQEAIQAGQVLGQFANAAPQAVLVMLKMFEQSFDEINLKEEDWAEIRQGIAAQMQRGGPQQGAQQGGNSGGSNPQIEAAIAQAEQQGVPREVAQQMIEERMAPQG